MIRPVQNVWLLVLGATAGVVLFAIPSLLFTFISVAPKSPDRSQLALKALSSRRNLTKSEAQALLGTADYAYEFRGEDRLCYLMPSAGQRDINLLVLSFRKDGKLGALSRASTTNPPGTWLSPVDWSASASR